MRAKADALADPHPIDATLAELDRLHEAATPGEWTVEIEEYGNSGSVTVTGLERLLHDTEWADPEDFERDQANGQFIATVHNAYPELRAEIERLRQANALLADFVGDERERALAARDVRMKALGAAAWLRGYIFGLSDGNPGEPGSVVAILQAELDRLESEAARLRREAGE